MTQEWLYTGFVVDGHICDPSHQNRPVVSRNENWDLIFMVKSYFKMMHYPTNHKNFGWNLFCIFYIFSHHLSLLLCKWLFPINGPFRWDRTHIKYLRRIRLINSSPYLLLCVFQQYTILFCWVYWALYS